MHFVLPFFHSLFSMIFGIIWLIIEIVVLIDIAVSPRLTCLEKVLWALAVIFLQCIGIVLYLLIGRRRAV